jgi:hypothetical protein
MRDPGASVEGRGLESQEISGGRSDAARILEDGRGVGVGLGVAEVEGALGGAAAGFADGEHAVALLAGDDALAACDRGDGIRVLDARRAAVFLARVEPGVGPAALAEAALAGGGVVGGGAVGGGGARGGGAAVVPVVGVSVVELSVVGVSVVLALSVVVPLSVWCATGVVPLPVPVLAESESEVGSLVVLSVVRTQAGSRAAAKAASVRCFNMAVVSVEDLANQQGVSGSSGPSGLSVPQT